MTLLAIHLPLLVSSALASAGGPDNGDQVFTDSFEANGPTHQWLNAAGTSLSLANDALASVELPFVFSYYGTDYSSIEISQDGAVFFGTGLEGPPVSCFDGSWTGIAVAWDDYLSGTVSTATLGTWPYRSFVISWEEMTRRSAPDTARFQLWLLEGRNEAVLVLDDLDLGNVSLNNGAQALIGTSSALDTLPYSCQSTISTPVSIWTAPQTARPARALIMADTLETPWNGTEDSAAAGRALAVGDVNGDGIDDLLVGAPDIDTAWLIYRPDAPAELDTADAIFDGNGGDEFGSALLVADLDGDGVSELLFGAPAASGNMGEIYLYSGSGWGGSWVPADADTVLTGQSTDQAGGLLLSGDTDGDGYPELVVGSPTADHSASNAGRVWVIAGGSLPGGNLASLAAATLDGEGASHNFGRSGLIVDLDEDGEQELVIGAPRTSRGASDAGSSYVYAGGSWSGSFLANAVPGACIIDGTQSGMHFGSAFAAGDLDESGLVELIIGAPAADAAQVDLGRAYLAYDIESSCPTLADLTDYVQGSNTSAQLGSTLAVADLNEDGAEDLLIAAPNMTGGATNAGIIYAFTTPPSGYTEAYEAQHLLSGTSRAGALGTQLATAQDGNLYPTLIATAPFADQGHTHDGALYQWKYHPDFQDDDGDGFVSSDAGGNDCDDNDSSALPLGIETLSDSIDGDCDGWVDGQVRVRTFLDGWSWDISEIGASNVQTEDFETYGIAQEVSQSYDALFSSGIVVERRTSGSWPRGARGATQTASPNQLALSFLEPIDGFSLRVLDPEDRFVLSASYRGSPVVTGYAFQLSADNRTGGEFRSFLFSRSIDSLILSSDTLDTWGMDQLQFVPASGSDRDGDGWSEEDGDCDDDNADISPDAPEVLGDSIDNNCDEVVDGGSYSQPADQAAWEAEVAVSLQVIDFEAIAEGESITSQYASLGASFQDAVGAADIDGTLAHSTRAASTSSIVLEFEELQPGVAFYVLDADTELTLYGYADGFLLYTASVTPASSDEFVGLVFEYGVDTLEVVPVSADTFGIDDVELGELGLDDADGDGYVEPDDLDDHDATTYPGAPEIWYDGIDQNGDGASDYDQDGDGADSIDYGGDDCDDEDASIFVGAVEVWYDGVDSDCDGASDYDQDADGQDSDAFGGIDCDDLNAAIYVGATEIWYDGVDQDCSADSDYDADGDGFNSSAYGGDDCDDALASVYPGAVEVWYDGVDENCDGANDYDQDGDGQDSSDYGGEDCNDLDASIYLGAIDIEDDGIDSDCSGNPELDEDFDGYYARVDCDDHDNTVFPGAPDACYDGIDSDCAGDTDFDCDGDGELALSGGGLDCDDSDPTIYTGAADFPYDGIDNNCDGASEYDADGDGFDVSWYGGTDCDDTDPMVAPGAEDSCYDGIDSNCDGSDDFDCDGDGFTSVIYGGEDCDDAESTVYPGASEISGDGVDSDCDGVDGPGGCTDCDGDGFDGIASGGLDCDDADPGTYPRAPEIWYNGKDEDCAGGDDYDADGDGAQAVAAGGPDCNDQNPEVGPQATEDRCGAGDEDCDGTEDEDCVEDSEVIDDSGSDDSGVDDSRSDDSGAVDSWRPAGEEPKDPEVIEPGGCGCSQGAAAGLLPGLLVGLVTAKTQRGRGRREEKR